MIRPTILILLCHCYCVRNIAQPFTKKIDSSHIELNINQGTSSGKSGSDNCSIGRPLKRWIVSTMHVTAGGASLYKLSKKWYRDYPSKRFYTVNDMDHWRMMDKYGHAWSAYTLARLSGALWRQTGMEQGQAVYRAGIAAMGYQTLIEVMDGFSSEWGFSWGDMGADMVGTLSYMLQELGLKKQVVSLKFMSFKNVKYTADIHDRAEELFGSSFTSQLLSDYNRQTYWASINIQSIFTRSKLPPWLNIAVGYGAGQMLGESSNRWFDKNNVLFDRSDILRYSRILISPDIDFTRIRTGNKILRTLFFMLNAVKIPAPALEFNTKREIKFHMILLN